MATDTLEPPPTPPKKQTARDLDEPVLTEDLIVRIVDAQKISRLSKTENLAVIRKHRGEFAQRLLTMKLGDNDSLPLISPEIQTIMLAAFDEMIEHFDKGRGMVSYNKEIGELVDEGGREHREEPVRKLADALLKSEMIATYDGYKPAIVNRLAGKTIKAAITAGFDIGMSPGVSRSIL